MGKTMRRSAPPRSATRARRHAWVNHRSRTLVAVALAVAACAVQPAHAAAGASLIVMPTPASGQPLSYFKLSLAHGGSAQAGTISLRNPSGRRMRVALDPVAGETIDTLGSTYGLRGSGARGPPAWGGLAARGLPPAPHEPAPWSVPVLAPPTASP